MGFAPRVMFYNKVIVFLSMFPS